MFRSYACFRLTLTGGQSPKEPALLGRRRICIFCCRSSASNDPKPITGDSPQTGRSSGTGTEI